MKYTPRSVIYLAVIKYLNEEQVDALKKDIAECNLKQDRNFLALLQKHFDFERLKNNPYIWQDIWLYDYLKNEVKTNLPRKGLIAKYEQEVLLNK